MSKQLDIVNAYFDLVQSFSTDPAAFAEVLHPQVEQTEFPNLLQRTLQRRSFTEILDNVRLGRELLRDPDLTVQRTQLGADGSVTVEGVWQATTVSDMGPLVRGQRLSGQVCLIFEFKDDKIFRHRRYFCYDMF